MTRSIARLGQHHHGQQDRAHILHAHITKYILGPYNRSSQTMAFVFFPYDADLTSRRIGQRSANRVQLSEGLLLITNNSVDTQEREVYELVFIIKLLQFKTRGGQPLTS